MRPRTVDLLRGLGNVTLLDRPLRPITMLSSARAALRARRRQYAARNELLRQATEVRKRDQFLAMLSHELRNPLGAIVLAADTFEAADDGQRRRVDIIRRQGSQLTHIIDDLLDVARLTTGKVVLRPEPTELNQLVERVLRNAEEMARGSDVALSLERVDEPAMVLGDPTRLEQVVGNLHHQRRSSTRRRAATSARRSRSPRAAWC